VYTTVPIPGRKKKPEENLFDVQRACSIVPIVIKYLLIVVSK
jgi:hypothetical protein